MQSSYWGYWLITLGIFVIFVMMLLNSVTTTNTQDYYQLKEVTEAAIIDAVDFAYYREYGEIKINKEKFVENFLKRFSETINISTTYEINFYDLYEAPPKVSVEIITKSNTFNIGGSASSFDIINRLDAIIELGGPVGPGTDRWTDSEDGYSTEDGWCPF